MVLGNRMKLSPRGRINIQEGLLMKINPMKRCEKETRKRQQQNKQP
jgi:hypothetical protein